MNRPLAAALCLVMVAIATASAFSCQGGGDESGGRPVLPVAATHTEGPSPVAQAEDPSPASDACAQTSPRDHARRFFASFGDPICLSLKGDSGGTSFTLRLTAGGQANVEELPSDTDFAVVPDRLSVYGRQGCEYDPRASLRITAAQVGSPLGFEAVVNCSVETDAAECAGIWFASDVVVGTGATGQTCIAWSASESDPRTFRVELTYPLIGRVFVFLVPHGTTVIRVPDEAAPLLGQSTERCRDRKDYQVVIFDVREDNLDAVVGSNSVTSECRIPAS